MRLLPATAILLVAVGCTSSRSASTPAQPAAAKPVAAAPATPEEAKAAEEKQAADAKAAEEKAAQAVEEKKAAEAKIAEEKAAKVQAIADKKAADEKAAADKVTEAQAAKARAAEDKKAAEVKAAEEKAVKAKAAADKKVADAQVAQTADAKSTDEKAAKAKAAADAKAAEAKLAADKAAENKRLAQAKAAEAKAAEAKASRSAPAQAGWAMKSGGDAGGQFTELKVGDATLRLRYIPPGSYTQGSEVGDSPWRSGDEMAHPVTFSRGFWLAETETTQALYQAVTGANPSQFTDPKRPVDSVSWHDAQSCINRLNGMFSGLDARLPSEAEWEYACRAGSTGPFAEGSTKPAKGAPQGIAAVGWTQDSSKGMTQQVGMLSANAWGLHDMHGNMMEWCQDAYANYPASANDPKLVDRFGARVVRGGSWRHPEWTARSAARRAMDSSVADNSLGFRILVPAKQ